MTTPARFLRGHGLFLAMLGLVLFAATLVGRQKGIGMFRFLQQNTVAAIGFHEAYALIALLGLAISMGAAAAKLAPWHLLAAVVHVFLTTINVIHWSFYAELGMVAAGYASTAAHIVLAGAELWFFARSPHTIGLGGPS